jgi:UDP-N-acetyl-2-amino-2-deoxyglucuronate dehydrogenase
VEPGKAEAMAKKYNAKSYDSADELLLAEKEVEKVASCSPNGLHAEHIIKSLQAGKDVLTEKPLCLTKAAAWQIIETAKFCRRQLFVVKSARYNPIIQQLKKAIDANDFGSVYSFHLNCVWNRKDAYYQDWKGKLFPDGGTLYNQFSHYIDVMLWLFGDVAEARGFRKNAAHQNSIEFEDQGTVALQMQQGSLGTLHWSVNAYQHNMEIALTIVAENGTIRIAGENLNEVDYLVSEKPMKFASFKRENWSNHNELYDHLMQALQNHSNGFPDAFDGLKTVETIEKIYKATT